MKIDTIYIYPLLIIGIVGSFFILPKVVYSQSGAFKDCVVKYCGGGGCYTTTDGRPSGITKCQDMVRRYGDTAKKMCKALGGSDVDCGKCSETLACQGADFSTSNPLGSVNVPQLVGRFLRAFFGLIGVIALVIFIYGGLLWMTSMGEEDRVKRGRETLIWAGMGLIAIFGSYVVVRFILDTVLMSPRPTTSAPSSSGAPAGTSSGGASGTGASGTGASGTGGSGTGTGTSGTGGDSSDSGLQELCKQIGGSNFVNMADDGSCPEGYSLDGEPLPAGGGAGAGGTSSSEGEGGVHHV